MDTKNPDDTDVLTDLDLAEADQKAVAMIEYHRAETTRWRQARSERLKAEHTAGRSVPDIAAELGLHRDRVYRLMRDPREPRKPRFMVRPGSGGARVDGDG